jgi:serine/threonine-protein kinase
MTKPSDIVDVIRAIAEGAAVDWKAVDTTPADASVASMLNELQIIACIAKVHGSTNDVAPPDEEADDRLKSWGPLAVLDRVGAGSYGVVYRAWDSRLDREVALKLLRHGSARTDAEIPTVEEGRVLARVRHPNVVTIYGADRIDGRVGLWMEFIEGRTLAGIVQDEGPLDAVQAARIGIEIARGLAAVHRASLLHRDVKAQNVMRQEDGRIVLMDFGTVRAAGEAVVGSVAGTALYAAPEVLRGAPASPVTDIYSLGVVLYHLMTGSYPVVAADLAGVRTALEAGQLTPLGVARGNLPRRLVDIVDRATAQDPGARFQTVDEVERALTAFVAAADPVAVQARQARRARTAALVIAALAVGGIAVAALTALVAGRDESIVVGLQSRVTSDAGLEIDPAISPDGRFVAYSAGPTGHMRVWLRQIAGGPGIQLTNRATGDERRPQWSPDGRRILFTAGGTLFTVSPPKGGEPHVVAQSTFIRSAIWNTDGRSILFLASDRLFRVPTDDGTPVAVRELDGSAYSLSISPDGSRVAYASRNPDFDIGTSNFANIAPSVIRVARTRNGPPIDITDDQHLSTSPIWAPDGKLLFVSNRQGRRDIYMVTVDANGAHDTPRRLTTGLDAHSISLSADGHLMAYSVLTQRANVWALPISDGGVATLADAIPLTSGNQMVEQIEVSPDGRLLYFDSDVFGNADVFRMPITGGPPERLTSNPSDDFMNAVSPSGREIAFHSFRNGRRELFVMPAQGGQATFVAPGLAAQWSPDGSKMLFAVQDDSVFLGHRVIERNAGGTWSPPREVNDSGCENKAVWRPDGQSILTVCAGKIQIRRLDGIVLGTVYEPANNAGSPVPVVIRTSPDGSTVYFKSYYEEGRAAIWSVLVNGGPTRLVARFDDPTRPSNRRNFTTDGRRLYVLIDDRQADVWVADIGKATR